MSFHVLLNLLNKLGETIRHETLPSILPGFPNEFNSEIPRSCHDILWGDGTN